MTVDAMWKGKTVDGTGKASAQPAAGAAGAAGASQPQKHAGRETKAEDLGEK